MCSILSCLAFGGCTGKTQFKFQHNEKKSLHMRKLCASLNSKPHEATPITSSSQYAQRQVMDQNGELQANVKKYFTAVLRFKCPKMLPNER